MRSVVPGRWDVRKLEDCGDDHDNCGNGSTQSGGRPLHRCRVVTLDLVDDCGVIGGVEIVESNMDDENAVEIDKEVSD